MVKLFSAYFASFVVLAVLCGVLSTLGTKVQPDAAEASLQRAVERKPKQKPKPEPKPAELYYFRSMYDRIEAEKKRK